MHPQSFYNRPTLKVAQDLLGCFLVRKINGEIIKAKIVETEAYAGPKDLASHASRGETERNKVMFGKPGIIYVYFTYGMHYMLNIVTEERGYPAAVLIRAAEPSVNSKFKIQNSKLFTNGPARLTKALKIDKSFNGLLIYAKKYGLWIESRDEDLKPRQIIKTTRVGVDYAGEYKNKLWRFYIKDNKFVSKK
ncbi:DNA-3-methyladenine glycosylase [Candidatus Parcubacteria bacterium]|nr:DNA-3-methyladenine glycosylase [Patescibacteria group bacterium]MCG2691187.1 DNA-3-methyladenine glycosylase [Candidatus Parcubacteria bacterium]